MLSPGIVSLPAFWTNTPLAVPRIIAIWWYLIEPESVTKLALKEDNAILTSVFFNILFIDIFTLLLW
jgi:hypothetical protein